MPGVEAITNIHDYLKAHNDKTDISRFLSIVRNVFELVLLTM